eukprot:Hpha_TRINITY_DN17254_c0_g1::TRINITY_DN17254_c0_g1_i1::g.17949::m.17949
MLLLTVVTALAAFAPRRRFQSGAHLADRPAVMSKNTNAGGGQWSVADFGAKGDGATDDTPAFAKALAACGVARGGRVLAGSAQYLLAGNLSVPVGCGLVGTFGVVPSHDTRNRQSLDDGTVLIPTWGRGMACDVDCKEAFITIQANAWVSGLTVYYREQNNATLPVAYPWTFYLGNSAGHGSAANAALFDVEVLGCWSCVAAVQAHRHYIARVQGQPINIGVFVDETYDIGRIEDVHFNPWFSSSHPFVWWQTTYGRAFVFGRSDWEYVFNTFAFGYAVGYHFIERATGSMNGNFLGIGMDLAVNASVLVEQSQPMGILITNGEFTAFCDLPTYGFCAPNNQAGLRSGDAHPKHVVVKSTNKGAVKFVNSAFWGPAEQVAEVNGDGVVTFSQCHFDSWDNHMSTDGKKRVKQGTAAVSQAGGTLIMTQNDFTMNPGDKGHQVDISSSASRTLLSDNVAVGEWKLNGQGKQLVNRDNLGS